MSGRIVATIVASASSSASTVTATVAARPRAARARRPARAGVDMARASWEKNEAEMGGASRQRGVDGLGCLQAADLDVQAHRRPVARNGLKVEEKAIFAAIQPKWIACSADPLRFSQALQRSVSGQSSVHSAQNRAVVHLLEMRDLMRDQVVDDRRAAPS